MKVYIIEYTEYEGSDSYRGVQSVYLDENEADQACAELNKRPWASYTVNEFTAIGEVK
jgi:hypothetical protein